jgi:hypothetical protein
MAGFERVAGSGESVALLVNKALDFERELDFPAAVKTLACAAFIGLELRELGLPETEDVGLNAAQARHVPNFEVKAVRDCRRVDNALAGKV